MRMVNVKAFPPECTNVWYNLAIFLGIGETAQVGGQSYTNQQCYVQSLTLDPKNAKSWFNYGTSLGLGETAQVRGQTYTEQQCYVQALTWGSSIAGAWTNLGATLGLGETAQVWGQSYTKVQEAALVGSQCFTKQQCYVHSLTLNPECTNAWYNLAIILDRGETLQVGRQSYTKQRCFAQALTLDPKIAEIWVHLGSCLGLGEWAQVGNQPYTNTSIITKSVTESCPIGSITYPTCTQCTSAIHCSSKATNVTTNTDRTLCLCTCSPGFTGSACNECAVGFINFPSCTQCTNATHCNGKASSVTSNSNNTACECTCNPGFAGATCAVELFPPVPLTQPPRVPNGVCVMRPPLSDGPSDACWKTQPLVNASHRFLQCDWGLCSCIGGTLSIGGNCSVPTVCNANSLFCLAERNRCRLAAITPLLNITSCNPFATNYIEDWTCVRAVCTGVEPANSCEEAMVRTACMLMPATEPPHGTLPELIRTQQIVTFTTAILGVISTDMTSSLHGNRFECIIRAFKCEGRSEYAPVNEFTHPLRFTIARSRT